jgi:endonuclease G
MSATGAKVALVQSTTALSGSASSTGTITGTCPADLSTVRDFVGFGTSANCHEGAANAPAPSNTVAIFRKNSGSQDTNDNGSDFQTGAPSPHNSGVTPPAAGVAASVTVSPATWSLKTGDLKTFTATARDANNVTISSTFVWSSSNTAVATVDAATGVVTAKSAGSSTITATAPSGAYGTATANVTVGSVTVQSLGGSLPVGFQSQLFVASGSKDANGNDVTSSSVTWSSSNNNVVVVNANTGIITAASAGSAIITATAKSDNTSSGSTTVTTVVATVGADARIGHNTDLGVPADGNPSDDIIIARRQYTISYNPNRGDPNWVSWNLDASHTGGAPRCNCFTADTALTRLGFPAYDTNDWINGGVWSRGHMSPSADWADTPGDNAPTYFLSNMLPQNQTMNAGAWGDLENYLRTQAVGNAEIYIVAGGIFTKNRSGAGVDGFGFMNSIGHIAVPDSVWKIAVILPDGRAVNSVSNTSDIRVIAVNMPNAASASGTWNPYVTTVNAIQRSTGYSLLSMLPDSIAKIVKANDRPPVPTITVSTTGNVASFSATFTDPDGRTDAPWAMTWNWGDGTSYKINTLAYPNGVTQFSRTHTYSASGNYTASYTVTDKYGASATTTVAVTVNP